MQATHPYAHDGAGAPVATTGLRRAQQLLHAAFVVLPVVAGLDKFANLLVDWTKYLAPVATDVLPVSASTFMYAVGVIEVIAGLAVALRPRFGGMLVAGWLVAIALNLVIHPAGYYDIAVRDLGLAIGAAALSLLSTNRKRY